MIRNDTHYLILMAFIDTAITNKRMDAFSASEVLSVLYPNDTLEELIDDIVEYRSL